MRRHKTVARLIALFSFVSSSASAGAPVGGTWQHEGPRVIQNGQVEGITDRPVIGAIQSVVTHPTEADTIYIGAVNGGVWKTTNGTAPNVQWTFQTANQASQSIGTLEMDPTDLTHQTLVAGIGRFSSLEHRGGARRGLLRTTDGGSTWTAIGGDLVGRNVIGLAPRGATLVVAINQDDTNNCTQIGIFRSTDTGTTWGRAAGVPNGTALALASDPTDDSTLYAAMTNAACSGASNGIYKSSDTGTSWTKVSNAAMDALLTDSGLTSVRLAVGNSDNVYAGFAPRIDSLGSRLDGVFRSGDGGMSWAEMDLPGTLEPPGSTFVGIHPRRRGDQFNSLVADPTDAHVVYIGGNRQPRGAFGTGTFPNSIGANDFSGRLFRGDAALAAGAQFTSLTHSGTASNSAPHGGSRDMAFDASGGLIQVDDGGIYKRTSPATTSGDWVSLNGDLHVTESHNLAYDPIADVLLTGNQGPGASEQIVSGGTTWRSVGVASAGDVLIDSTSTPGMSIRYVTANGLGTFERRTYNAANELQSVVTPALTLVGGGPPIQVPHVMPMALNRVDPTRIVLGGTNSLYESLDRGDTMQVIAGSVRARGAGRSTIAAGATGNADMLYVGGCIGSCTSSSDGLDGIFVRSTNGGALVHSLTPASPIEGVAIDPERATDAFAVDAATVHFTHTGGIEWLNLTANLGTLDPGALRSIVYVDSGIPTPAVVVGADRGAFITIGPNFQTWQQLGTGLPEIPVVDLHYQPGTDTLYASTLGLGTYSITPVIGLPTFALEISPIGTGSGTITSDPEGIDCPTICEGDFTVDSNVTLAPTPDAGSAFVGWSGDADCEDGTVTMTEDLTCDAQFDLLFTLTTTLSGSGNGSVASTPTGIACPGDCDETFVDGTTVTLTPMPSPGSAFAEWTGDADCVDGRVTLTADITCDARFEPAVTMSISISGMGMGSVGSIPPLVVCSENCEVNLALGTELQLLPVLGPDSFFVAWTGDPDCQDGRVTMTQNLSCNAEFDRFYFLSLTLSGAGSGTVTGSGINCPTDCMQGVPFGTVMNLTAEPDPGSVFVAWSGPDECLDGSVRVESDVTCDAQFEPASTLAITLDGEGAGTVTSTPAGIDCPGDCSEAYPTGSEIALHPTAASDSVFTGWTGDDDCRDGVVLLDDARSCIAHFVPGIFADGFELGDTSRWSNTSGLQDGQPKALSSP